MIRAAALAVVSATLFLTFSATASPNAVSQVEIVGHVTTSEVESSLDDPCEPGKDIRSSDLCAQWKAADAAAIAANAGVIAANEAKRATDVSERTFWVSSLAIGLSFLTTIFTLIALRDGRKSSEAAQKMVRLGQPSLAPHPEFLLTVERDAAGNISKPFLRAAISWHNLGERAAKDVVVNFVLNTWPRESKLPDAIGGIPIPMSPIQGGQSSEPLKVEVDGEDAVAFLDETRVIFLWSLVVYKDALGEVHSSTDKWVVSLLQGNELEEVGRIIWPSSLSLSVMARHQTEKKTKSIVFPKAIMVFFQTFIRRFKL